MKERPILFNGEMIRAVLDGSKTQTRRVVKPQPDEDGLVTPTEDEDKGWGMLRKGYWYDTDARERRCPYGVPGDRLWVRETWAYEVNAIAANREEDGPFIYRADNKPISQRLCEKWTPSIHMPRWASRILLEVVSVRVERVQEITNMDAKAEGLPHASPHRHGSMEGTMEAGLPTFNEKCENIPDPYAHKHDTGFNDCWMCGFRMLWNSINAKRGFGWDSNPWLWVVEFKKVEK